MNNDNWKIRLKVGFIIFMIGITMPIIGIVGYLINFPLWLWVGFSFSTMPLIVLGLIIILWD